jgi:hypothetical protein
MIQLLQRLFPAVAKSLHGEDAKASIASTADQPRPAGLWTIDSGCFFKPVTYPAYGWQIFNGPQMNDDRLKEAGAVKHDLGHSPPDLKADTWNIAFPGTTANLQFRGKVAEAFHVEPEDVSLKTVGFAGDEMSSFEVTVSVKGEFVGSIRGGPFGIHEVALDAGACPLDLDAMKAFGKSLGAHALWVANG